MADGMASITLGNDIVKPIIEAKINEAIYDAMRGSDDLIRQAVFQILNLKVDSEGKSDGYNKNQTFLAHLANKAIREAATLAVQQFVAEKKDEIRAAIVKEMSSKKGVQQFAAALTLAAASSVENAYRVNIAVNLAEKTY